MDIPTFIIVMSQLLVILAVAYVLRENHEKDKERQNDILTSYSDTLKLVSTTFMEEIGEIERVHFQQVEKQSAKQLDILGKQTKDFLTAMTDFVEVSKPQPVPIVPDLLDNSRRENTIEKEETPEIPLDDMSRIPMVEGIKGVRFEDEEEIFPIDIQ